MDARALRTHVLELIGPAGVGKSSLVQALLSLDSGGYTVGRPRSVVGWSGAIRSSVRAATLFAPQYGRVPSRPGYRYRILIGLLMHQEMLRRRTSSETAIILDQGPIYLLSILQRALRRDGSDSRGFLRAWEGLLGYWAGALHLVVSLDAPDEVLFGRVQARGTPHPLLRKPRPDAAHALRTARKDRQSIVEQLLKRNPSLPVLSLSADDVAPIDLAERVHARLMELPPREQARRKPTPPSRAVGD